jgi:hypothetical protein
MKKYHHIAYKKTLEFYDKDYEKLPVNTKDGKACLDKSVYQCGFENGIECLVPVCARIARSMGSDDIAKQIEQLLEQESDA